jgi:hypothetical protein
MSATPDEIMHKILQEIGRRLHTLEAKYETQRLATLEWGKDVDKLMRWIDDHLKRIMALEQRPIPGFVELAAPAPEAAPVATDEEVQQVLRYYDLGRQHGAAQAQPPFAADKVVINCPETCWVEVRRVADGKVLHDNFRRGSLVLSVDEPPAAPPAPAGGLVERVEAFIPPSIPGDPNLYRHEARAAIREVAAWLAGRGMHGCALWLREEAGQ